VRTRTCCVCVSSCLRVVRCLHCVHCVCVLPLVCIAACRYCVCLFVRVCAHCVCGCVSVCVRLVCACVRVHWCVCMACVLLCVCVFVCIACSHFMCIVCVVCCVLCLLSDPHFVRCVNPNTVKRPHRFDKDYVLPQLRCGGLIQALSVMKLGYPTRLNYHRIFDMFRKSKLRQQLAGFSPADFCEGVMIAFGLEKQFYQLGISKVDRLERIFWCI